MKNTFKNTKSLIIILLITFITSSTFAQQGGEQRGNQQGPPPIPTAKKIKTMVNDLSKEILLTDEQATKVLKLYTSHFEEVKERIAAGRPDRNEMEKLKTTFKNEIKALLTDDQKKLYSTYIQNNRYEKGGEKRRK